MPLSMPISSHLLDNVGYTNPGTALAGFEGRPSRIRVFASPIKAEAVQ